MAAARIKETEARAAVEPIKVRVLAPYRVIHKGVVHIGSDVIEVPNDVEHKTWLAARWVELVTEEK